MTETPADLAKRGGGDADGTALDGAAPRSRMPLSRVVELLLTKPTRAATESVVLTRNAKGDYQYEVTAIAQDGETLAETAARVRTIAENLDATYELSRAQHYARKTLPNEKP